MSGYLVIMVDGYFICIFGGFFGIGENEVRFIRVIIIVCLIRLFEYRNIKYVVFKYVLLE